MLVVAAACSGGGSTSGSGDEATTATSPVRTAPSTAAPGTFNDCAGYGGADLSGFGVTPGPPKKVAQEFVSRVLHWDDALEVRPRHACEVRLRSARARVTASVLVDGSGDHFLVEGASTSEPSDEVSLSVGLIGGHVSVYSGLLCPSCTSGRFVVLHSGGQASVPVRPTGPVEVELDIPPAAVRRALLILLAGADGVVRAAELVSVPDGDFAAS